MKPARIRSDAVRTPKQERSQKRVDQILEAAREIIRKKGSAGLTIGEIANNAGVTPGSMYQYFPNKSAIVYSLGERYLKKFQDRIESALSDVPGSKEAFLDQLENLLEEFYQMHRNDPVARDIWMGVSVDKSMQDLNKADTQRTLELLTATAQSFFEVTDHQRLRLHLMLMLEFSETATRLAISLPKAEGRQMIDVTKRVLRSTWAQLDDVQSFEGD